jgi:antitoxin component of RelBE/YafQ-DinJ toxin-antitoxin module
MKKRLSITIDEFVLSRAKRYASARGVSLSSLVEGSLREMAGNEGLSFSARWKGRFRVAGPDRDLRHDGLAKKYL